MKKYSECSKYYPDFLLDPNFKIITRPPNYDILRVFDEHCYRDSSGGCSHTCIVKTTDYSGYTKIIKINLHILKIKLHNYIHGYANSLHVEQALAVMKR